MNDRAQVWIFIALVLAASWGLEAFIIANGGVGNFGPLWIAGLMCIPGLLSLLLRLVLGTGFADVGFQPGKGRYYAYAVAVPLVLALLAGLLSKALDIRTFSPLAPDEFVRITPAMVHLLGLGLLGAFGEELGWRGFLLPRMMSGGFRTPYLGCGLVWASWHLPLIALGGFYPTGHPLLMALVYGVGIVAMSFVFSELRLRSGSVWVATVAHAAHNFIFQFALPVLFLTVPGSRSGLWDTVSGDTGLSIAALYVAAYVVLRRVLRRHGSEGGGGGV